MIDQEVLNNFLRLYVEKTKLEAELKDVVTDLKSYESAMIDEMNSFNMREMSLDIPGLHEPVKILRTVDYKPSVVEHELFAEWAKEKGLDDKLELSVKMPDYATAMAEATKYGLGLKCGMHPQTLKSQTKKALEDTGQFIPGTDVFTIEKIQVKGI